MLSEKFAAADPDTLKEIMREAESFLSAQLTSALAANQRAISFANFLAAATAVVGSGSIGLLTSSNPKMALGLIGCGITIGLLTAMAFAIGAALPTEFWYVGNSPAQWVQDIEGKTPFNVSLSQQVAHYAKNIERNDACMSRCDRRLTTALKIAWCSLAIGGSLAAGWIGFGFLKAGS